MNPDNCVRLVGTVREDPREGASWTRYRTGGRGQIRFWLAVSRELAGAGFDVLLCALEPERAEEISRYSGELRAGRTVHLEASAKACGEPQENNSSVIFVAHACGFDGAPSQAVHAPPRRHALHGKSAAAGDREEAELELQLKP